MTKIISSYYVLGGNKQNLSDICKENPEWNYEKLLKKTGIVNRFILNNEETPENKQLSPQAFQEFQKTAPAKGKGEFPMLEAVEEGSSSEDSEKEKRGTVQDKVLAQAKGKDDAVVKK